MPPKSPTSLNKYTKYNGRRKPELLDPDTFSLVNYHEAERVLAEWKAITDKAEQINAKLPSTKRATRSTNWCCTRPKRARS